MWISIFSFSSLFIFFKLSAGTGETRYDCKILELFFLHFNLIGWILLLKILKPKEKIYFKWVCRLSSKWNNNNNKNIAVMLTNWPNRPDSLKRLGMLWPTNKVHTYIFSKRTLPNLILIHYMEVTNACINILRPVLFCWSIHDDLKKIKHYKFIFQKWM